MNLLKAEELDGVTTETSSVTAAAGKKNAVTLDLELASGGGNLSAGQKQMVA